MTIEVTSFACPACDKPYLGKILTDKENKNAHRELMLFNLSIHLKSNSDRTLIPQTSDGNSSQIQSDRLATHTPQLGFTVANYPNTCNLLKI